MESFIIFSTSPILLIKPEKSSILTSGIPPVLVEITGTFAAIASRADNPKLSISEGKINKSLKDNILLVSLLFPKNITLSLIPNLFAFFSALFFYGPSPIINNFDGTCFCIPLNISRTSIILLTFLKLLTCVIIL